MFMSLKKIICWLAKDYICQFAIFMYKISIKWNILNQGLLNDQKQMKKLLIHSSFIYWSPLICHVLFLVLGLQQWTKTKFSILMENKF